MSTIICDPTTNTKEKHVDNLDRLWDAWNSHDNIRRRFSDSAGNFKDVMAENALKDFVEFKLNLPLTEDFILDLYEKSKKLEGEKKKKLLKTIELLSAHVGEYLVE